jgi:DNA-binding NarL/FixJ family response regulator
LSTRELAVLRHVAGGQTNKEIATADDATVVHDEAAGARKQ